MKDYAAIATQYARDIVDGRILSNKFARLACLRHLKDLARAEDGWRYEWNPELVTLEGKPYRPADRICVFIEMLPHVKGEWFARAEKIRLEPWQVFIDASIFGWVDRETKRRRFREADLFVPRKNAKSTNAAGIGLYMFSADGEFGAEVYSGATTEDQAYEVFDPAKKMAEATPEYLERFGVTVRASNLSIAKTNSKFEPVIGKPGDGASPSCAIVDEFHEHLTDALRDTMKTGMGARAQPLLVTISTAGDDVSGPCYQHQEDLQEILEGIVENERRFGIIYGIDQPIEREGQVVQPGDDWTTEIALIKANPNYGVSVDRETLLADQAEAIRNPRKQAAFQTKHLNMWVGSSDPWLNLHEWKALGDPTLKIEDFYGEDLYHGMDLANVVDIAGDCRLIRKPIDGLDHYYAFWRLYLPEARINEPENRHYLGWKREGWLIESPGNMIDQRLIENNVVGDMEYFCCRETGIDDWGSAGITPNLEAAGLTVVRVPQMPKHLSAPMKFIDGLVQSGRIHHCGDPVATWGVSNVSVKPDRNDNWFPRRGAKKKKIDPALMLIIAMSRAMLGAGEGSLDDFLANPITTNGGRNDQTPRQAA
ncbi:MAG: terminase TerL endonuclease subunit [Betaproteobacteria bacterium]